ncbi:uncharacterized protein DEA37_0007744, partial [Paragonimus westermani]
VFSQHILFRPSYTIYSLAVQSICLFDLFSPIVFFQSYVNPKDYDVIRFWIRGVHPQLLRVLPTADKATSCGGTGSGALRRTSSFISCLFSTLKQVGGRITHWNKRLLSRFLGSVGSPKYAFPCKPTDPCFTNVLLAVRRKQDNRLHLKFFEHVPASKPSSRSTYTDNLVYLLPELRFRPLTTSGRLLVSASLFTALSCLGLVAPLAWLLTSNPDLVIAWSVAASMGAGATTSLVWSRYWRAQARMAVWFKLLHFDCGRSSGSQAVNTMLQLARDEEYKAALIAYALMLRPTEAGSPLNPVQLGVRAESWIAKRLSPQHHLSVSSATFPYQNVDNIVVPLFAGGSGPLFDLTFEPKRPLELLKHLDLVRGTLSEPRALPLAVAASSLRDENDRLTPLWILDPLVEDETTC